MSPTLRVSLAAVISAGLLAGCQNKSREPEDRTGTAEVSPERLAEIRQRYSAVEGWLVGDVEEVDAQSRRAAVSGIDPKLVPDRSLFIFVDASDGTSHNSGTKHSHSAVTGRIFVAYHSDGPAPKRGDIAVTKAGNK